MTSYQEAWSIMRGDYEFSKWMWLPASNKHWLLLLSLIAIGGSVSYISIKLIKRVLESWNSK